MQDQQKKKAVFLSRFGNELLMAPTYCMYLSIVLLGMFVFDRLPIGLSIDGTDYLIATGGFFVFYLLSGYFSLGKNYQDIIIEEDQLEIVNRIPGFRKQVAVKIEDIEEVRFSESHINLEKTRPVGLLQEVFRHPERKWLEIHTKSERLRCRVYGLSESPEWQKSDVPSYGDLYVYLKQECGLDVRRNSDQAA